jgi:hypothetical protein
VDARTEARRRITTEERRRRRNKFNVGQVLVLDKGSRLRVFGVYDVGFMV